MSTLKYTEEEMADLTDAEREALLADDNEETTAEAATDEEGAGDGDVTETTAAHADAVDGADAAADTGAGDVAADATGAEGAGTDQPAGEAKPQVRQEAVAPVLVAEAPADVEAKLAELSAKKDKLEEEFDEGNITRAEYRKQMDAINKDERGIERAQHEAELAAKMNEQAMQSAWIATAQSFAKANGYSGNPRLYRAFDLEVQDVANSGKHADWASILETAHANMVEAGLAPNKTAAPAKAEAKPVQQKIEHKPQPPNLAIVPAAAISDTSGNKYAALDRLASAGDIDAYEEALAKLPEAERDRYLAA